MGNGRHNGQPATETVMARQYCCRRCDVTWYAREDERVADVCWLCETADESFVFEQLGRPVRYYPEEVGL